MHWGTYDYVVKSERDESDNGEPDADNLGDELLPLQTKVTSDTHYSRYVSVFANVPADSNAPLPSQFAPIAFRKIWWNCGVICLAVWNATASLT